MRKTLAEQGKTSQKRRLSGPRAVATGAVLYTAVRAAFVGGRLIRAQQHAASADAASSATPTPRPKRRQPPETGPPPSLALPNQRWSRLAAARR